MVDNDRLSTIMEQVRLIFTYDLEKLSHEDEVKRIQLWNELKNSESIFDRELGMDLPPDLRADIASQFSFAELRLAVAEQAELEPTSISNVFNGTELSIVPDYDKYNIFDITSANELAERMQRKSDIYHLALQYIKEYSALDAILDSPQIRKDLKIFLKKRYHERLNKVNEGIQIYIGRYGLGHAVKQIEKSVLDTIKQSEAQRVAITEENKRNIEELSVKLKSLPEIQQKTDQFNDSLDKMESRVSTGESLQELKFLEPIKEGLADSYKSLEREIAAKVKLIEQRNGELAQKEAELEKSGQKYPQPEQEEKQRLIESELKEVLAVKDKLGTQAAMLNGEKDNLEIKRQEITDRLRQLNEIAEGKSIRYISSQDARLCEMNLLARFDTKMQAYPLNFHSPLERKEFVIRSWSEGAHVSNSEQNSPDSPWNVQDRYVISEKKHGMFGEKVNKIIIEAITLNHLDEFDKYKFDARSANLADFLNIVNRIIDKAEVGKYLHIVGIASPTGWDEKVQNEVKSTIFAHNYISRFVSFCLIDSVTGEIIFNPSDDRITKYIEYFTPEFNREKSETVRKHIMGRLAVKDYVVLDEVVDETTEPKAIVNKVFYDLQHEGKGKIKYIKGVGLVIQTVK
jgi:hypothetical protein